MAKVLVFDVNETLLASVCSVIGEPADVVGADLSAVAEAILFVGEPPR